MNAVKLAITILVATAVGTEGKVCETSASDRMKEVELSFMRATYTDIELGFGTHTTVQCIDYNSIQAPLPHCSDSLSLQVCNGATCNYVKTGFYGSSFESSKPVRWFIRAGTEHIHEKCLPMYYHLNIVAHVKDKSNADDSSTTLLIVLSLVVGVVLCACLWLNCCRIRAKFKSTETSKRLESVEVPTFNKSPLTKSAVYSVEISNCNGEASFIENLFLVDSTSVFCLKPSPECESVISDIWCDPCSVTIRFIHHIKKDGAAIRADDYSLRVMTNSRLDGILRRWEDGKQTDFDVIFEKEDRERSGSAKSVDNTSSSETLSRRFSSKTETSQDDDHRRSSSSSGSLSKRPSAKSLPEETDNKHSDDNPLQSENVSDGPQPTE